MSGAGQGGSTLGNEAYGPPGEMVDAADLKSADFGHTGSSPVAGIPPSPHGPGPGETGYFGFDEVGVSCFESGNVLSLNPFVAGATCPGCLGGRATDVAGSWFTVDVCASAGAPNSAVASTRQAVEMGFM